MLEKLKINPKWEIIECKGDSMESLIKDNGVILHSLNFAYQDLFFHNGEYLIVERVVRVCIE